MISPKYSTDRFLILYCIVFIIILFIFKSLAVLNGSIDISWHWDEAARLLNGSRLSHNLSSFLQFSQTNDMSPGWGWFGIHPPGDVFFRALTLRIPFMVGFKEVDHVSYSIFVSMFAYLLMLFFAYRIGYFISEKKGGVTCVILFSSSTVLNWLSLSTAGEVSGSLALIISFFFLTKYYSCPSKDIKSLVLSSIFIMIASIIRSETLLVLPGICLALIFDYGIVNAILYGALASFYMFVKSLVGHYFLGYVQYYNLAELITHKKQGFQGLLQSPVFKENFVGDIFPYFPLIALILFFVLPKPRVWRPFFIASISSFLILCFFMASGQTHLQARNFSVPIITLIFSFGVCVSSMLSKIESNYIRQITTLLVLGSFSTFACLNTQEAIARKANRVPIDILKARKFIELTLRPNDVLFCDKLYYWDWYF
ncbi:hypothetical protein KAR91_67290, partial [Candidatus Pacearchaeota archaeon]|nr:hypothetical protein [Candidatus Pacearchaeota archaeon]